MTNPVFPTLSTGQDSTLYSVKLEDSSMKTKMEGGYVITRSKHTRKPRRTYKIGFTQINANDRVLLEAFYGTVAGGAIIFDYYDPVMLTTYNVRFQGELDFKYTGMGNRQMWDVQLVLEQA